MRWLEQENMKAQIYPDDDPIVRLFETGNDFGIADLTVRKGTPHEADAALRKMRLRRKETWRKTDWGWEARVAFSSNIPHHAEDDSGRPIA